MAEKSALGIVEIIMHVICAVLCFGVLVASGVAISNANDYFKDVPDDSDAADDRDKYIDVAGWLVFVGIAGLITQVIMAIIRGLYYGEVITSHFLIFGITCAIFCIVLALALISGGIASAVNAADIKEDYIDPSETSCDRDDLPDEVEEDCNNLQAIRDAQAASAALAFLGAGAAVVATVIVLVSTKKKRDETV